jgi:hypothetical protein
VTALWKGVSTSLGYCTCNKAYCPLM